jgi:dTMP kinase
MSELTRGILIAIEGIDGSGKSTLAQGLKTSLEAHDFPVLLTKEPGGTSVGLQIRSIVQEKKGSLTPKAEFLLFAADRAQHYTEAIAPALRAHKVVISDRLSDSSLVYQGYGRGLDRTFITAVNAWVLNNSKPDLTFYVRVEVDIALSRIYQRQEVLTAFEQEHKDFFKRLNNGFEELYGQRSDVMILNGNSSPEYLVNQAITMLTTWLAQQHLFK